MTKKDPDLVPYYRPGTTEPEMVPRNSVPGSEAVAGGAEPIDPPVEGDGGEITEDEPKAAKGAKKAGAKKAAKKR
jgi:hypothetical protein